MKLGHWPKLHICSLTTPRAQIWAYLRCMGSGFRDTDRYSKLPYLGMNLAIGQSSRSCTYTLFLPQGVEIELIFTLRAAVSEIQADFQHCHIWTWNLAIGQSSSSCTYNFFLPQGVEIELIFALRAAIYEIQGNFQNIVYILPKLRPSPKVHSVCSTAGHFQDIGKFAFSHCHKVKFQSFFKFKFKISKFQEANFVWTITGKIQKKFRLKRIKTVGGVAFWNCYSHRVPC